jgi:hypothetical protein
MTLETVEEAQRIAATLPAVPTSPWSQAMTRVQGIPHGTGRRPREAGPVELDSTISNAEALAFATIVAPKRRSRGTRGVAR